MIFFYFPFNLSSSDSVLKLKVCGFSSTSFSRSFLIGSSSLYLNHQTPSSLELICLDLLSGFLLTKATISPQDVSRYFNHTYRIRHQARSLCCLEKKKTIVYFNNCIYYAFSRTKIHYDSRFFCQKFHD